MDKIYSFLGLARKAGKVISGDETCERTIRSGKACLVIIAENASNNTKKKFADMCLHRDTEIRLFGDKELLGKCIGKDIRSVVCVLDYGFAGQLIRKIDDLNFESGGDHIVEG